MRPPRVLLLTVLATCLPPVTARAEQDFQEQVGFSPNHMFEAGTFGENVDVTTGNLTLTVPLGPKYQLRELSHQVVLTYNAKIWDYVAPATTLNESARKPYLKSATTFGVGWTYHEGRIFLDDPNSTMFVPELGIERPRRIQYEAPDGSRHALYAPPNVADPLAGEYLSKDNSYLKARAYTVEDPLDPENSLLVWKLSEPDGTARILGYQVGDGKVRNRKPKPMPGEALWGWSMHPVDLSNGWYTIRRESARRAPESPCYTEAPPLLAPTDEQVPCTYIEYFYGIEGTQPPGSGEFSRPSRTPTYAGLKFIRDSIGRRIDIVRETDGETTWTAFYFPHLGGTARYDLVWGGETVNAPLGEGAYYDPYDPNNPESGSCLEMSPQPEAVLSVLELRQIRYPGGYTMTFGYDGPDCERHGMLTRRTLPTGAINTYEYMVYKTRAGQDFSSSLIRRALAVAGQPDAVWEYARDPTHLGRVLDGVPAEGTNTRPPTFMGTSSAPDYSEPTGAPSGNLPPSFYYTNPPRVWEKDPDGNLTLYHLYTNWNDPRIGQVVYPQPEMYGTTRYVERILGGSPLGVAESVTSYSYTWDEGTYDVPYDKKLVGSMMDTTPNDSLRANLRRRVTNTMQVAADDSYRMHRVEEKDWDEYGHARTKAEYAQDSTSMVYRTTRTNWLTMPGNPDVAAGDVGWGSGTLDTSDVDDAKERWNLNLVTSTEVVAGASGAAAQKSRTMAFDHWGVPLEVHDYPDPQDTASFVRTVNTLDPYGQVLSTAVSNVGFDPETVTTHFTRNAAGQVLHKKFGSFLWKAFDRDVDLASGLTTRTRTPAGVVTDYAYDSLGRLTEIAPSSTEHPTLISYPNLQLTTVSQGPTTNRIFANYRYDQAGRLRLTEKITSEGTLTAQELRYDLAGRKVFESEWVPLGTADPPGTTYEYWVPLIGSRGPIESGADPATYTADPLGRVTRATTADGAITETVYDVLTKSVTVHDLNRLPGSTASVTPSSTTTLFASDVFGRLVQVDVPAGGEDASYSYDILDNLVRVDMGAQVRTFVYDGMGRLKEASNPENGTVTFDAYGPTGLLKQKTEESGARTYWMHDAAGRIFLERYGLDYLQSRTYFYDTPLGGSADRAAGRLVAVERYGSDTALEVRRELIYTGLNGRLGEERTYFGALGMTDGYATKLTYNSLGLINKLTYPERMPVAGFSREVDFDYKNGFLVRAGEQANDGLYVLDVAYNAAGGKALVKYGNGTWTEIVPDERNRPSQIEVRVSQPVAGDVGGDNESSPRLARGGEAHRGGGILDDWLRAQAADSPSSVPEVDTMGIPRLPVDLLALSQGIEIDPGGGGGGGPPPHIAWDSGLYSYDGAGNIIGIGDDTFSYDKHGRLTGAGMHHLLGVSGNEGVAALTWTYDGYGNMLQWTREVGLGNVFHSNFTFNAHNQIATLQTPDDPTLSHVRNFAYDPAGNVIADGQRQLLWDALGRLREIRRNDGTPLGVYSYDDRDYRARKVEDGFETFYVRDTEGRVLSELRRPAGSSQPPAWDQDYIYALGHAVATVKNDVPQAPEDLQMSFDPADPPLHVSLRWKRSTEEDVWGYRVYRRPYPGTSGFTQLGPPGEVSLLHAGQPDPVLFVDVPPAGAHEYYVTTVDSAGYESTHSRHLAMDPAQSAPVELEWAYPEVLEGDQSLELRFYAPYESTLLVNGFKIYRRAPGLSGQDTFALITPDLLLQPGYIDTGLLNDQLYEYKVAVVMTNGAEPDLAALPVRSGTPRDLVPPSPPTNVRAMPGTTWGRVQVSWSPSNAHDLMGYRLYEMDGETAELVQNNIPKTATSVRIEGLNETKSYRVTAFDDATPPPPGGPNESTPSATVTARPWADGGDWVYDNTGPAYRKIFEFGERRGGASTLGPEPFIYRETYPANPGQNRMGHGQPVQFRAARLLPEAGYRYCQPPDELEPIFTCLGEEFLGFNVYRSGCPDENNEVAGEVELLTPEPYFELDNEGYLKPFLDTSPSALCHIYYLTVVGSANGQHLESGTVTETRNGDEQPGRMYPWAYGPTEIMGQYAFGARLTSDPPQGDWDYWPGNPIAIHPEGGWELGSALPGTPVVLRWRRSPHPDTIGYRIWVHDIYRCTAPTDIADWCLLGDEDLGPLETAYLDYGAPKGWPVLCTSESCVNLQRNSCFVWPEQNLNLYSCPCLPGTRWMAEYFVEGVTADSPPRDEATPSHVGWDRGFMLTDRVRAIRLEDENNGVCPTGPGQPNYHPYCNGGPLLPNNCGGGGDLSLPESPLPASPEFVEPVLVAGGGPSRDAGPVPERRVLGELVIREAAPDPGRAAAAFRGTAESPAPDRLVGQLNSPTTTQWLHVDHLGSTRVVTDSTGAVVSLHKYLPFGEEYESFDAPGTNSHKFTGHERDEETGLDYMMARYYGNSLGRFLSVDPADDSASSEAPQTWNRYTYAFNNPIRFNDPDGEDGNDVANWVGRQVSAAKSFVDANTGGSAAGVLLNAAVGTAGDLVSGAADMLRVGAATGEAIGSGQGGTDMVGAVSQDVARAAGLFVTLGAPAAGALSGGESAATSTAGTKITGFTKEGINQTINRGVKPAEMLNATKSPIKQVTKTDAQGRVSTQNIGTKATVVTNPQGKVVTTWKTSSKLVERIRKQQ